MFAILLNTIFFILIILIILLFLILLFLIIPIIYIITIKIDDKKILLKLKPFYLVLILKILLKYNYSFFQILKNNKNIFEIENIVINEFQKFHLKHNDDNKINKDVVINNNKIYNENKINVDSDNENVSKKLLNDAKKYENNKNSNENNDLIDVLENKIEKIFKNYKKITNENIINLIKMILSDSRRIFFNHNTKIVMDLEIGTGDPYSMGQILSYLSYLYSIYENDIRVKSNFDKKKLLGFIQIENKLFLFKFLVLAIKIFTHKGFKDLRS